MKQIYIECTDRSREELHRALVESLRFPNGHDLSDALMAVNEETLVCLNNLDTADPIGRELQQAVTCAAKKNPNIQPAFTILPQSHLGYRCAITDLVRHYWVDGDRNALIRRMEQLLHTYRHIPGTSNFLEFAGEDYIVEGDPEAALIFFRAAEQCTDHNCETNLYLRLAQLHLEKGLQEEGVAYLIKLCTETVDNYEESLAFYELTDVWNKYKHLVEGLVPPSVVFNEGPRPLSPAECSRSIEEIFALPEDDLLSTLSDHLGELSGSGEELNYLNKWERCVYYLDELSMEVNSGGFDSYLFQHGEHYHKAKKALENLNAPEMTALLDAVAAKFPRGKVPKSMDAIQNAMEKLEEKGVDFEDQDDAYYGGVEQEFLTALLNYVLENRKHFR